MGSSKPQQPEQRRSGHSQVTKQDHAPDELRARDQPGNRGGMGPVPEDNQPGQRPARDQDKPDPERFLQRLSGQSSDGEAGTIQDPGTLRAAVNASADDPKRYLYRLARELKVPGRSGMDKQMLASAVHDAGQRQADRASSR